MKRLVRTVPVSVAATVAVLVCAFAWPAEADAQQVQLAQLGRGPRFMAPVPGKAAPVEVDITRIAMLRRRVSLNREGATVGQLLREISEYTGVQFAFEPTEIPIDRVVGLRADSITVAAALTEILVDAGVDVLLKSPRQAVLLKRTLPGTISGRVTDAVTGQPIALSELRVVGTGITATTDDSGTYLLRDVPAGEQQVTARRIGYRVRTDTVTVPDGGTATLDFALAVAPTQLDELVSTVTGDQRRLEIGNAITRIRTDSVMLDAPIRTFQDLLEGRAPGVQVLNTDGVSGASNAIRIRGVNSFTVRNDPLIVIDGVRAENTSQSVTVNRVTGTGILTAGRMSDLNPEEIESMEIVKGPSAATLYGTDAANGVIVITTKRGRPGRAQWTVSAEHGLISDRTTYPESYYAFGRNLTTGAPMRCTTQDGVVGACVRDSLSRFSPLRDPELTPISTGFRNDLNLQVSGGSELLRYFVAGGYEQETGTLEMPEIDQQLLREARGIAEVPEEQVRPNALERITLRGNFTMGAGKTADLTLAAGYTSNDTRFPSGGGGNQVVTWGTGPGFRDVNDGWNAGRRPSQTFVERNREVTDRFTVSLTGNWGPTSWLTARATAGVDNSGTLADNLFRAGESLLNPPGARLNARTNTTLATIDLGSSADFDLSESINSRTSVGVQYNRRHIGVTAAQASGLPVGSETVAGAVTNQSAESTVETVVAGTYLEQTFGWRDRLFVTGAVRFDGGSSFGSDFNTAVYPKASASWVLVGADGERRGPLSSLRLRGAYGQSGVQPDPIAALARYELFTTLGGSGAGILGFGNPLLKPERQVEYEAGIDAELWHGRVRVEATAYSRRSRDALVNRPLGPSLGIASVQENIGAVRNRGLEGGVTVRAVENRSLTVDLGLNGFINQNRLLDLGENVQPVGAGQQGSRQTPGYPLYGQWFRPILGYADVNGNGTLEPSEVQVGDTAVYVGVPTPTQQLTGTMAIGLFNERLRLSGFVDYRGGHKLRNGMESQSCQLSIRACRALNDPTTPLADQAAMIAQDFHGQASGGYVADASYLRLREIAVSYTLPPFLLSQLRARSATVTLAARNLATLTNFPGLDPEALSGTTNADQPGTAPVIPPATYWIARITLGL